MPEPGKKSYIAVTYIVLILSTLAVFWQVRDFDFVNYDDDDYIYKNTDVTGGLSRDSFIAAFTTPHVGNWLPMVWLSFALDCHLFGVDPGWMHLVNVFFHIANTLLLFALLKNLTGGMWQSAFVAAAFALHPMHVESVAWITERKDVLSTFFLLLTIAAYVSYVRRGGAGRYLLAILLYVMGLLAKPMIVTVPVLLLLLDYWPLRRFEPRSDKISPDGNRLAILCRMVVEKIPFFILSAVWGVITFFVQRSGGAVADLGLIPLHTRIANAFISYAKYTGRMFWPRNMAVFHPYDAAKIQLVPVAVSVLLTVAISVLVIRFRRRRMYLFTGWLWFVVALLPVIGLIQSGAQSMADRYTYIPYIGLFIAVAWGVPELVAGLPQRRIVLGGSAIVVLTALGIVAHGQTRHWRDSLTLFSHAVEVTRNNDVAHNNRGITYYNMGRRQEAMDDFKRAIEINPNHAEAHSNLGNIYVETGRLQEAFDSYRGALQIEPRMAEAHYGLGLVYGRLGRWEEAAAAYEQAVSIQPDDADGFNNLGVAYGQCDRWEEATEAYKQALRIQPDLVDTYCNLGVAYGRLGRRQEALGAFERAVTINPYHTEARYGLANELAAHGRDDEAVKQYRAALELAEAANQVQLATTIRQRLLLYEGGRQDVEPKRNAPSGAAR